MGTLFDLNKRSTHDYVDNPFWSVFQIKVKYLLHSLYVNQNESLLRKKENERYLTDEQKRWMETETKDLTAEQKSERVKASLL